MPLTKHRYYQLLHKTDEILGEKNYKNYPFSLKIDLMKSISNEKSKRFVDYKKKKAKYENLQKIYKLNVECRACLKKAEVTHHLVQLQHGGTNYFMNRVPLCRNCHKKIHLWL